jgi:hypothetical protein
VEIPEVPQLLKKRIVASRRPCAALTKQSVISLYLVSLSSTMRCSRLASSQVV